MCIASKCLISYTSFEELLLTTTLSTIPFNINCVPGDTRARRRLHVWQGVQPDSKKNSLLVVDIIHVAQENFSLQHAFDYSV